MSRRGRAHSRRGGVPPFPEPVAGGTGAWLPQVSPGELFVVDTTDVAELRRRCPALFTRQSGVPAAASDARAAGDGHPAGSPVPVQVMTTIGVRVTVAVAARAQAAAAGWAGVRRLPSTATAVAGVRWEERAGCWQVQVALSGRPAGWTA